MRSGRMGSVILVLTATIWLWSATGAGAAPTRHHVTVVIAQNASLHEWLAVPEASSLFRSSAVALLSTRTGEDVGHPDRFVRSAFASLGSGRRAKASEDATALGARLNRAGITFGVENDAGVAAQLGAENVAPTHGPRPPDKDVTIWIAEPPHFSITPFRDRLGPSDTLIVLSFGAERTRDRIYLGAIAITGFGYSEGLLTSPSTRRAGIVTLADVAPTIAIAAGENPPASMQGRPMTMLEDHDPTGRLARMDSDFSDAEHVRSPLLRAYVWLAIATLVFTTIALISRKRIPRSAARIALTILCAGPLALLLEPIVPHRSGVMAASAACALLAIVVGGFAYRVLGASRAIATVCAVTAVLVLADLVLGGALAIRSPISYTIAEGARFYGIGNELMGVVVGCTLVAVAFAYDRQTVARAPGALLMTIAVAAMAAPSVGAKFGSVFVAVPAFGVLAARAGGRRATWRLIVALECVAAALTGVVLLADRLRPSSTRSHIGNIATAGGTTFARKALAAARLAAGSVWMIAVVVGIAAVIVVYRSRREDVGRMLRLRGHLKAALAGGVLGSAAAIAFNDAGMIAAAFVTILLVAALFAALDTIDLVREQIMS